MNHVSEGGLTPLHLAAMSTNCRETVGKHLIIVTQVFCSLSRPVSVCNKRNYKL